MHPDTCPTRRSLLRGGGLAGLALLAGCVTDAADPDGAGSPTAMPSSTPTPSPDAPGPGDGGDAGGTRPAGTGGPGVTLVGVTPPAAPLDATVELVEPVASAASPPLLHVTLTNAGDRPVRVGEGRAMRFQYVHDTGGHLVLLPAGGDYPAAPDCWRLREGIAVTEEYRTVDLAPGAVASATLALYGAAGGDGCLPAGEFAFETRYALVDGAGGTWGFRVLLE
jgi:hypothetical protein